MIKIKGHSNFNVYIETNDKKLYVVKKGDSENYKKLVKSINKQIQFKDFNIKHFSTPEINEINNDKFYFKMKFIENGINIIDYLNLNNLNNFKIFFNKILKLIDNFIIKSTYRDINKNKFINKLDSVIENIQKNDIITNKSKVINLVNNFKLKIPNKINIICGFNHGDLTFSNILYDIDNGIIYLIDFLDNIIETPINDIVKLIQETKYNWTLHMYDDTIDKTKIEIITNYFYRQIIDKYKSYDWFKHVKLFLLLNFIRILPYVKTNKKLEYVYNICNEIYIDL